jgi:Ser/Thr protein kinase RdoA (MazF antagonist)
VPEPHDAHLPPFESLTGRGQVRRLRALARNALEHYDLPVERMSLLRTGFNTIFRLNIPDGRRYVLRVNYPNERTLTDIRSETAWLTALTRDTDLVVPEPVATRDGEFVVTAEAAGVPEPRHCAMFGWINGRNVRRPSKRTVYLMGETLARLHDHTDTFQPPPGFTDLTLDEVWAFGIPGRLNCDAPDPDFTPERRVILRAATDRVQQAINQLYRDRSGLRFLHADLHYGNIRLQRGRLNVLDFDDSAWGYPVQDIGISLYYLQHLSNVDELRASFMEGYLSLRPSPEQYPGQIDDMIAFRRLDLLSYVTQAEHPDIRAMLPGMLERSEHAFRPWLEGEASHT